MVRHSIADSELRALPPDERARVLAAMMEATRTPPTPDEMAALDACIADFERAHGMTTAEMRQRLRDGVMQETEEMCRWSMRASLRKRLAALVR